ncbi:MAG TPA: hypothetical protein ENN78_01585 [Candidatus Omnitrophica bacterium]|nr:hypothetical protein [Candidatus Omnitrophota bacterium]
MAHLLHNPNFNPGISLQEKVAEYLLNNLDGLKEDSEIKRIVIGSLLWSGAVQNSSIDSLLKERITSEIEARCITEDNRSIWEDFGVLVLGEFDELEHLVIYAVIDFLPPAIKPPYFITTGRIGPNGNYDFVLKTVVLNMELVSASFLARVLIHEIGHHVHCGQFTAEENDRWKELWALSLELEDFACYYGRENMLEDIATAFESYVYNTQGFLAQTTANLEQSGRDVRLRKIEFLAKLFAHTSADGTPVTYAYEIHGSPFGDYFSITLRQVALAEQVIVGETYLLPDCDRVINSRVYEYNGWSSHDN